MTSAVNPIGRDRPLAGTETIWRMDSTNSPITVSCEPTRATSAATRQLGAEVDGSEMTVASG